MTELPPSGEDEVAPGERPLRGQGRALAAVAAGGMLGALARWAVGLALPHLWATFGINVLGGLAIGLLIVEISERRQAHPLVRPFVVTGILGGFTTFSTASVDAEQLLLDGHIALALAYASGTLAAALLATAAGLAGARAVLLR